MSTEKIQGVGVALISPFKKDGSVDFLALENLLQGCIVNSADFLVAFGTTAEAPTLKDEEKRDIWQLISRTVNGKIPLVYGLGGNDTRGLSEKMERLSTEGVSHILSVAPFYNKPSQEGIYQHYKHLCEYSPLPIIVYNIPGRTGVNVEAATLLRMAEELPKIVAVKEASCNLSQIMEILKHRPKGFSVLSGDDAMYYPILALGGDGVISSSANFLLKPMLDIYRYYRMGNVQKAMEIHYEILDLINLLFKEGNPSGLKAVMEIAALCENTLRLPLLPVSSSLYQAIKENYHKLSL